MGKTGNQQGGKWDRKALPWRKADYDKPFGTAIGPFKKQWMGSWAKMYDMATIFKPADDNSYKKAVKAAAALEAMFADKLAKLLAAEDGADKKQDAKAEPKGAETTKAVEPSKEDAKPKAKTKISKPEKAPDCFGSAEKLHAGFLTEEAAEAAESLTKEQRVQSKKCLGCVYESDCAAACGV